MRPIPEPPGAEIGSRRKQPALEIAVEVCLITRLYGGGARTGRVDEKSWIRPPAFKAALRFWWRAAYAHPYSTLAELHRDESRLFGCPGRFADKTIEGGPGLVEVRVESATLTNSETDLHEFQPEPGSALMLAYFAAPLPHEEGEKHRLRNPEAPGAKVRAQLVVVVKAESTVEDTAQIESALRLFLLLGGVGSRTRRGAGAIAVVKEEDARKIGLPVTEKDVIAFLRGFLRPAETAKGIHRACWALASAEEAWIGRSEANAETAQIKLLEALRDVRQDRPHPKSWQGAADWGRSRWPEADAIRLKARKWGPKHPPKPENASRYPRAALGLPIVVHYKDGQDPANHTISAVLPEDPPKRLGRFASPLLLRPVRVWERGEPRYVPVAILGPMTLPAEALPLVELEAKDAPAAADVVASYPIADNAGAAFDKTIEKFRRFQRIVSKENP